MKRKKSGLMVSVCKNTQPDLVVGHGPDQRWSEDERLDLQKLVRAVVYKRRREFVIEFREPGKRIVQIRLSP